MRPIRPDERLTLDPAMADFVVDVANVVRERSLGGDRAADLGRLLALLDGLAAHAADDEVQVYAVTDRALLSDGRLTSGERAELDRWYRAGLLEVLPVADDRIVEIADTSSVRVVTRDGLLDFYRRYPWLPGNRDRFLRPEAGPGGTVTVRPRVMPVPDDWQISGKEEESELLAAGLYDRRGRGGPRADLLLRRWRCPEADCPQFGASGGGTVPTYRRGTVRCPTHDEALTDSGPRPRQAQLKVRVGGRVRHKFLVVERRDVAVGRAPADEGGIALAPWLDAAARAWISRSHVVLRLEGPALSVRDTSANGTRIRVPGRADVRLRPGSAWRLGRSHAVLLHDTVSLELSGRNFVFDAVESGGATSAAAREAEQPTMLAAPPPAPRRSGKRRRRR